MDKKREHKKKITLPIPTMLDQLINSGTKKNKFRITKNDIPQFLKKIISHIVH